MSSNRETEDLGSLAGLSTPSERAPSTTLGAVAGDRYREIEVVGEGGLGTVLRAHDRFLGRDVALKRIGPRVRGADGEARFLREARITARLDHPGIVPIHDAGVTEDGRIFYTMRLIRGRSLEELAREALTPDARLALVGAVTAACHAVGAAHRQGVIHRDLKPANIMIGALGEVQVVDWGLAEAVDERDEASGFAGTIAYASPEIVGGTRPTPAADVFALGVTLYEVFSGEHRFPGDRDAIVSALAATPLVPARWPASCPPELAAIGDRAMATRPADRYEDAHAMAQDLDAFRDGRRVAAHPYTSLELARRLVRAWRWPIAAVATLVLGTVGALALTSHRTERERQRAVGALANARAGNAVAALAARSIAGAESAALDSLAYGEHPDARGVLAATLAAPRPRATRRVALPSCTDIVATSATTALCLARDRMTAWDVGTPSVRWSRDLALEGAVAVGDLWLVGWTTSGELVILDARTGVERSRDRTLPRVVGVERAITGDRVVLHDRHTIIAIDGDGTPVVTQEVCGDRAIDAAATTAEETYVICAGGHLGRVTQNGLQLIEETGFGTEISAASALAISETSAEIAIGSTAGDVMLVDVRGCFSPGCEDQQRHQMLTRAVPGAIRRIACLGTEVIVIGDRGDAVHLRRGVDAELTRLPISANQSITFLERGGLVAGGDAFYAWELADRVAPSRLHHVRGLTTAAVSLDRSTAAAVTDDGALVVWDARTGQRHLVQPLRDVRELALSDDGSELVVTRLASVTVHSSRTGELLRPGVRQTAAAEVVATATRHRIKFGTWEIAVDDAEVLLVRVSSDQRWLAAATETGRIDVWNVPQRRLVARLRGHDQRVSWLQFDRDRLWSAGGDGDLRWWQLAALDAPIAELTRTSNATWGLSRATAR